MESQIIRYGQKTTEDRSCPRTQLPKPGIILSVAVLVILYPLRKNLKFNLTMNIC